MERINLQRMREVWNQGRVPVLLRRPKGKGLRVRLPYDEGNRTWLRGERRSHPKWDQDGKYWEIPKAWFNQLVADCLNKFGFVYIIQPYREQEKCAPACWNAEGDECECACMGEHHGMQSPAGRWRIVSDTFATRWDEEALACRLVTRRS